MKRWCLGKSVLRKRVTL